MTTFNRNRVLSPLAMLAMSMHAQPGVYAVLLGSGVSTGAGIPTGWGIIKELVGRVAAASDPADPGAADTAREDPEKWWRDHGEGELGYATLLEQLAPTPAARQGLLQEFFEPNDEEKDQGLKQPSLAHQAVAQLVKDGYIRVIVTTNFDRLTEIALQEVGISPQVIAHPDAVKGMAPLAHSRATVIKLHGDYLDLGSRNTPEELDDYPEEWTTLLDRVFDEYGLLISGWSADWDTALVDELHTSLIFMVMPHQVIIFSIFRTDTKFVICGTNIFTAATGRRFDIQISDYALLHHRSDRKDGHIHWSLGALFR